MSIIDGFCLSCNRPVPYWGEPNYGHADGCPGVAETEHRNGISRDTGRHHFNGGTTSPLYVRPAGAPRIGRHRAEDTSIVRALTADFTDHSDARRCGCGACDQGAPRPVEVAQAGAGGAAPATNFHREGNQ